MSTLEPEFSTPTAWLSLTARAEPGVLPRVLEYFAKRGLTPHRLESRRTEGGLTIDIRMTDMDQALAAYIGRCLRGIVAVESVLVDQERRAGAA